MESKPKPEPERPRPQKPKPATPPLPWRQPGPIGPFSMPRCASSTPATQVIWPLAAEMMTLGQLHRSGGWRA